VTAEDHFRVEVRQGAGQSVLSLHGELDLASAPLLERELQQLDLDARPTVVLDLQELDFIDSTGLRTILSSQERVRSLGGEFAVTRGSPQVQRLLAITRADEHLQVLGSSDELVA
jgi:anti-sigma B factor antagonist